MQEFDLLVIGGGSGGVRAARFAANFGAKVALAEGARLGGTCVNVGCIPKKFLMYAAEFVHNKHLMQNYGFSGDLEFNWQTLIHNKNIELARLNQIYNNLLTNSGVTVFHDFARLISSDTAQVGIHQISAKYILLAPGGTAYLPKITGIEHAITSNELFALPKLPAKIAIVGGGYIAVEFASILQALGAKVTLIYRSDLFLRGFDQDLRSLLKDEFTSQNITLKFNNDVTSITKNSTNLTVQLQDGQNLDVNCVLYATGRVPNLTNLGLKNAGVILDDRGFIAVDANYQTFNPQIFAIGDAIGKIALTPTALAEGMAVARYLFAKQTYQQVDYSNVPSAIFSLPNLASCGLTEEQAKAQGFKLKIFSSKLRALKLTLSTSAQQSLVKLIVDKHSDKILGAHIAGENAGEIMQAVAVAIKANATKAVFDATIGIHPTLAEELVTLRNPTKVDA